MTKEDVTAVFNRSAGAYRQQLEEWMAKGQAAGRDAILDYLKPRPWMRILDLACGPGTLTIPMARELNGVGEVVGVDLSPGMLEAAHAALRGRSLPVRFLRMDMENLQFPLASFDAAACGHGLQFTTNLGRALAGVKRVLKPRARFAASVPGPDAQDPETPFAIFQASVDRRLGKAPPPDPELARTRAVLVDVDHFAHAALAAGFRFAEAETVEVERSWPSAADFVTSSASWWSFASRLDGLSAHVRDLVMKEATKRLVAKLGTGPFVTTSNANVLRAEA